METTEINENVVKLAYKFILGRDPESEEAVRSHMHFSTVEQLRNHIMNSPEGKSKMQSRFVSGSKWVSVDVLGCFRQWVDLHDSYVSYGCLNNNWEPSETGYFISKLRAGDVVLDIGANIGWFSLVAAKHIGKEGVVHAFEPRPDTAKMLKRTMADNGLRNRVHVWEFALSDEWGTFNLVWGKETDNPGGSFVSRSDAGFEKFDSAKVKVGILDDILPDVAPDIIKIDVEGAEPKVMRGAQNALRRKHPSILSELHPSQLRIVSGFSPAQYIDQMKSCGYSCYLLENGIPTRKLNDFPMDSPDDLVSVVFEWSGTTK